MHTLVHGEFGLGKPKRTFGHYRKRGRKFPEEVARYGYRNGRRTTTKIAERLV